MKKDYRFAGIELSIEIPDSKMYTDSRDLAPFEVEAVDAPHCFRFELVEKLTPPAGVCRFNEGGFRVYDEGDWSVRYIGSVLDSWENAYVRAAHRGREHYVQMKESQCVGRIGTHTVLGSIAAEHLVARAGGFVFHSSYIVHDGRGILFTAPSGTGKSTQAELWRSLRGAEIINGDRSVVRVVAGNGGRSEEPTRRAAAESVTGTEENRLGGFTAVADGIPFAGSSQICKNVTAPLAAIVYLGQAPQTTIRQLRGFEAFRSVWEGVSVNTWDETDVVLVSETVQRVVQTVPVYRLDCTPDESAVAALEREQMRRRSVTKRC